MAGKNQVIHSKDLGLLERLNDEYYNYLGRSTRLNKAEGSLTIFALPSKYKRKSKQEQRARRRDEDYNPEWAKYSDR